MKNISYIFAPFVLLLFVLSANAKVLLPQILSSNMVLQRDEPILIWGFAAPGEKVTVSFAGQVKKAIANATGTWELTLAALRTSAKPQTMKIVGSNTILLDNILVGEVWLCSGQSNMEYAMRKIAKIPTPKNAKLGFPQDEVANAKNTNIRIFLVNRKTLIKPDSVHKSWSIAQDSALKAFSAVGYFFAKELQEKLNIPIGIIESAVSGSAIEPWISKEAFDQESYFKGQKVNNDPGKFYAPMIEPLGKFKLKGFLWYQGETNCFLKETISYAYKMKMLINLWRKTFNNENAPFYYVQIAPYNYSKHSGQIALNENTQPEFWEAQAQLLKLPNTGMVVTTDLNDNGEDLHPTYKWEVGRRLSLWALANTYHQKINFSGPFYSAAQFGKGQAKLEFNYIGKGLQANDSKPLNGFEIAGADGKFVPATAKIVGASIVVAAKEITAPSAVRFSWNEMGMANFYNKDGLPALPFRTDNPLTNEFKPTK
jgi:sialate O-acetylesterase